MATYTLPKDERLYLRNAISRLFAEGKGFVVYPYRVIFRAFPETDSQVARSAMMVVAPKKKFKHAVDRNHVKRLTREAYRLNKLPLVAALESKQQKLDVCFLYLDNKFISFEDTQKDIQKAIQILIDKLH